jgi:hypothetical protein
METRLSFPSRVPQKSVLVDHTRDSGRFLLFDEPRSHYGTQYSQLDQKKPVAGIRTC